MGNSSNGPPGEQRVKFLSTKHLHKNSEGKSNSKLKRSPGEAENGTKNALVN